MRQLNTSLTNGHLNALNIAAVDTPSQGEAQRRYQISGFNTAYNPSNRGQYPALFNNLPIFFHEGPIYRDTPLNGVTEESLFLVLADRLRSKLATPEACPEHQVALEAALLAANVLSRRSEMVYSSYDAFQQQRTA